MLVITILGFIVFELLIPALQDSTVISGKSSLSWVVLGLTIGVTVLSTSPSLSKSMVIVNESSNIFKNNTEPLYTEILVYRYVLPSMLQIISVIWSERE